MRNSSKTFEGKIFWGWRQNWFSIDFSTEFSQILAKIWVKKRREFRWRNCHQIWQEFNENLVEENNTKFVENLSEFAGFVTEIVTQIGENLRESPKFSQFYRKSFRLLYAHRHWWQTAVYPSVPEKSLSLQTSRSMLYIVRPFDAKQLDTQNNSTTKFETQQFPQIEGR